MPDMVMCLPRVTRFENLGPYTLRLAFEDGVKHVIDFEPFLYGAVLRPLRDLAAFNAVRFDPRAGSIVWPAGELFDVCTLHDWPAVRNRLPTRCMRGRPFGR